MCTAKLDPHNESIPDSVIHSRGLMTYGFEKQWSFKA